MNCDNHPDKEAHSVCSICKKNICDECLVTIARKPYCKECVDEIVTKNILKNAIGEDSDADENVEDTGANNTDETNNSHKFRSSSDVSDIIDEELEVEDETNTVEDEEDEEEYVVKPVNSIAGGISTGEYIEELEEANDEYAEDELASYHPKEPGDLSEESYDVISESPDAELEAKYEKYLEDLHYDEENNNTPEEKDTSKIDEKPVESIQEPIPDNFKIREEKPVEPTQEPIPDNLKPKRKSRIKPELQTITEPIAEEYSTPRPRIKNKEDETPVVQEKKEDIIVPAHVQERQDDGLTYEEIREKLRVEEELRSGGTFENRFRQQERFYKEEEENYYRPELDDPFMQGGYEGEYAPYDIDYEHEPRRRMQVHGGYKEEKPKSKDDGFTKGEIALSIILIILIIIVMSYVIYLFTLSNDYPSYLDAVKVLFSNPAQIFENILN